MNPSVLVIIVTFNPMPWIDKCIESLRNSSVKLDAIIIDNGSTDGGQAYIQEKYPEYRFVQNKNNEGFGKANNIGLRYALDNNYNYVYLLNQDAWIFESTIKNLIDEHKNHPEFGIISPLQVQANGIHFDKNFKNLSAKQLDEKCIADPFFNGPITLYPVSFVMAAHWLISRDCLLRIGGFSPSFRHYGEDDNLCHRASYHGYSIGISTKAKAVHDREGRVLTKEKKLFFENIQRIITINNPNKNCPSLYYYFKDCIFSCRKNRSLKPLLYFFNIFVSWKQFMKNKESSKEICAFL